MTKKPKTVRAWGGFCADRLYAETVAYYDIPVYAVFRTRRDAKKAYEDVRRVEIRVLPPKPHGRPR